MRFSQFVGALWLAGKMTQAEERAERLEVLAQRNEARAQQKDAEAAQERFQDELCRADRELANQHQRRRSEIDHWVKLRLAHGKGEGFRVFGLNPFTTTLNAIQGRITTAVPYDDGRTKGYLVYDNDYEDPRILTIKQFGRRYRAWVHSAPIPISVPGSGISSSSRRPMAPSQSQIEDPRFQAFLDAEKQANSPGVGSSQPEPASYARVQVPPQGDGNLEQFCGGCGTAVIVGNRFCVGCGRQLGA